MSVIHLPVRLLPMHVGAEFADVVGDGDRRLLPCRSALSGQPYTWELCRVTGSHPCEPTPLEENAAGQSLDVTFNPFSNTGVYSCVAQDGRTILDSYYQLTSGKQRVRNCCVNAVRV